MQVPLLAAAPARFISKSVQMEVVSCSMHSSGKLQAEVSNASVQVRIPAGAWK